MKEHIEEIVKKRGDKKESPTWGDVNMLLDHIASLEAEVAVWKAQTMNRYGPSRRGLGPL